MRGRGSWRLVLLLQLHKSPRREFVKVTGSDVKYVKLLAQLLVRSQRKDRLGFSGE